MANTVQLSLEAQIKNKMKQKGIKKVWLAEKLNISPAHLSFMLKEPFENGKREITDENLRVINLWLETDLKK